MGGNQHKFPGEFLRLKHFYLHPILSSRKSPLCYLYLVSLPRIQSAADMGIAMVFLVAFTFIPVGFVIYAANEYKKKEKQLQYISGVGPVLYWITALVWDMVGKNIFKYHLKFKISQKILFIFFL